MKNEFDYVCTVLGNKIAELNSDRCGSHQLRMRCAIRDKQIKQLQKAMKVFMFGQGYLTKSPPIKVISFRELLNEE